MLSYDPGVYLCEIMEHEFGEIKGGRPKLSLHILPKRLESDPQAPLPMPSEETMPRVDVILWSEKPEDVQRFADDLFNLGFRGDDIAQICQGHTMFSTSLIGNEIRCRRKTATYTAPTGKVYERWSLEGDSSRARGGVEVDEIAAVEKLRSALQSVWSEKMKSSGVPVAAATGEKSPF